MKNKVCCFIGHRKIPPAEILADGLKKLLVELIERENVRVFLFGSRSAFDDLCHTIVSELQTVYPDIRRVKYKTRSDYTVKKEEKAALEYSWSSLLKREIRLKDYEEEKISDRVKSAGIAAYVERNQEMINDSDYAVFYFDPSYVPPERKRYKNASIGYRPKSGTRLAWEYAEKQKNGGMGLTIFNTCRISEDEKD